MRMNDQTYMSLVRLRDRLDSEQAKLHKQLEDVRVKLDSVSMTLSLLDGDEISDDAATEVAYQSGDAQIDTASLGGMTQLAALKKIAEHNGGILHTSTAKRLFNQAHLIKNPKNANNIIFSVIHRSEIFERVGPGVYRLVGEKPTRPEKPESAKLDW
jgi:hypothetical protein